MKRSLSKAISRLFDLYGWSLLLNFLFLNHSHLTAVKLWLLVPLLIGLEFVLPLLIFVFFIKHGLISDLDITERRQRPRFFGILSLLVFTGSLAAGRLGNYTLFLYQLSVLVTIALFLFITLFWKISGHTLVNSLGIFFVNYFFAGRLSWLYLLLLPVAWSRYYLKKHTLSQLLAGALLGTLIPWVLLEVVRR